MAESDASETRTLDPVVVEALMSITKRVYHRRGPRLQDQFRRYFSMLDGHSRDYAIAAFKHLRHGGYDFPPFLVRRWALTNGWKKTDAQLLDDYAAGVIKGVKYHHQNPIGHNAISIWQLDSEGKGPWADPGRPQQGVAFTRKH
jgi:hypothetical protein